MLKLFALKVPGTEPSEEEFEQWLSFVDESFRARVRRFRLWQDALRSLGGRLVMLWYLLSSAVIGDTASAKFDVGPHGKPILVEPILQPSLDFNVAHDGDYVLLGIQRGGAVGVDIMAVSEDQVEMLQEALEDQMTLSERQGTAGLSCDGRRALALTTIWCVKEAYVKALGEGVGFGLDRIEVVLDDEAEIVSVSVDGREIVEAMWTAQAGYLGEKEYRWVCISSGSVEQTSPPKVKVLGWGDILNTLASQLTT